MADAKGSLSRRGFLGITVGLAVGAVTGCSADGSGGGGAGAGAAGGSGSGPSGGGAGTGTSLAVPLAPGIERDPFTLGVASGEPTPDGMVLWTRLAPEPLAGGGMPDEPVEVLWELADDEAFTRVVAAGVATARPEQAHSLRFTVRDVGLQADRWYWYRFRTGSHTSRTGRTRTAPVRQSEGSGASDAGTDRLRLAFASCQDWQDGYYTAHHHLAAEDIDLVVWLGDFIYEDGVGRNAVRPNSGPAIATLDDYRARYAQYLMDPDLQASRAAFPWVVTRDDHEVVNNYAGDGRVDAGRQAIGYQAWAEHQPVGLMEGRPGEQRIYRTIEWGGLASLRVLDLRQYRTVPPCGSPVDVGARCDAVDDPNATMLGEEQRQWLVDGLRSSSSRWDLLASEVVMAHVPFAGPIQNFDQWDGYAAERRMLAEVLAERAQGPERNTVVLTGDIHAFFVNDITAVPEDPTSPVVATELVGGAISSKFVEQFADLAQQTTSALEQVHYADLRRNGYGVLELTADRAQCDFRVVSTTAAPTASISTAATFVIDAGRPGARPA